MERDLSTSALTEAPTPGESHSAVSWGAVFAGAAVAMALSFVLVALAGGFGLKLLSPWPGVRGAASNFTPILGSSMIAVQVVSSALGGYLAGRLRTRWTNIHGHEAHFRDTAHGLLTWAVSTIAGVVLVASVLPPVAEQAAAADIAGQVSLFMGVGLLLSAFTASVAAAVGGLRREEMHTTFWTEHARAGGPAKP